VLQTVQAGGSRKEVTGIEYRAQPPALPADFLPAFRVCPVGSTKGDDLGIFQRDWKLPSEAVGQLEAPEVLVFRVHVRIVDAEWDSPVAEQTSEVESRRVTGIL